MMLTKPMFWQESLAPDYSRIFTLDNFVRTKKYVPANALDMLQEKDGDRAKAKKRTESGRGQEDDDLKLYIESGCIPAGSYARLYVNDVSAGVVSKLCTLSKRLPVIACGLLQHESKISVLHFRLPLIGLSFIICLFVSDIYYYLTVFNSPISSIKKHDSYDAPIKAKEELLFHVGFRQFIARLLFFLIVASGTKEAYMIPDHCSCNHFCLLPLTIQADLFFR